jgi:hypothetical protein
VTFRVSVLVLAAALGLGVHAAQAVPTLSLTGGVAGQTPNGAPNDLVPSLYGTSSRQGYYGGTIHLDAPGLVEFTYLGREAAYLNQFQVDDGSGWQTVFDNNDKFGSTQSPVGSVRSFTLAAGIIPFRFYVHDIDAFATNGSNPNDFTSPAANFFASFDASPTATSGSSLVLFLDDTGAADDDDHDDMLVRLTALNGSVSGTGVVPEPGSMILLGSGLAALLAGRRSRRSK